jgi:dihydrofolate reductase
MRKIIVLSFISLDGVMQAPGRPEEDTSNDFIHGGWVAPYFTASDNEAGEFMAKQMRPADLLLGRKTFEIFANYWPNHTDMWPSIQHVTKYVISNTIEENKTDWHNVIFLKNIDDIKKLKNSDGSDLQVHGSGQLIQALLQNDLVDELWLKTFPVILGQGKKLFDSSTIAAAFTLTNSLITTNGVIFANYMRAGDVATGVIG